MPVHDNGLVTRHQLDHPAAPVAQAGPALETVLKFNPNHGPDGRFASAGGGGGARRGGTAGPPTTGAFGQKLPRPPKTMPPTQRAVDLGGGRYQTQENRAGALGGGRYQTQENKSPSAPVYQTAHALRNRVNSIAPGKRLDYAESRANKITDYYKQPLPRANAAAIAADKSKWTPGKSFAEHRQTMEFRKGMAPAKAQTMEFRHGVTEPARAQTMEFNYNAPSSRVQAASGLRPPASYGVAGLDTRLPNLTVPLANSGRRSAASKALKKTYRVTVPTKKKPYRMPSGWNDAGFD